MAAGPPSLRLRDAIVLLAPLVALVAWAVVERADVLAFGGAPPAEPEQQVAFAHEVVDAADLGADCKALADIDGDGVLDIVVADDTTTPLQWYEGDSGRGHVIDDRVVFTTDMETGDVDGDGDPDVIVPDFPGETLLWFANPRVGGGDWTAHEIGAGLAHDLAAGDVDGDGDLDVVARGHAGATLVFLQDDPLRWTRVDTVVPGGEGVALGDLDDDGDLDLVEDGFWVETPADPATGSWRVHRFADGWPSQVSVQTADLDDDGDLDVVLAASESEGRMAWYANPGRGEGAWVEHPVDGTLDYVHDFQIGDIDLDGDLDIAFAEMHQSARRRVGVLLRSGDGWRMQVLATTGSHNLRMGDLEGDGDLDLVGVNWDGRSPLEVWRNLRSSRLDDWARVEVDADRPDTALFIDSADVDGDGDSDLVSGAWWYEQTAEQTWTRHEIGEPLGQMATVADLDGDGDPDVLGTTGRGVEPSADFVWAQNDGRGRFTIHDNVPTAEGDFLQGAVTARLTPGGPLQTALSWHEPGHGTQLLTTPDDPVAQEWTWERISDATQNNGIAADDLDGDGDADLVLGTRWLRNDGSGWTPQRLTDATGFPDRVLTADVDGDGDRDVIVGFEVVSAAGDLVWYERPDDPSAPWPSHLIATVTGPMSVDAADVDGDGDLDVVVGEHDTESPETARLLVMENRGGGAAWSPHTVWTGDEHHDGAHLVDSDGDGDLDIASIGWTHPRVLLYENTAMRP